MIVSNIEFKLSLLVLEELAVCKLDDTFKSDDGDSTASFSGCSSDTSTDEVDDVADNLLRVELLSCIESYQIH